MSPTDSPCDGVVSGTSCDPVATGDPIAAWAVLAGCAALVAASLVLWAVNRPAWTFEQWFFVVDLADAVVYGAVAWLLITRSRHPVAWLLALTAVGGGLAALGAQWTYYLVEHPDAPSLGPLQSMQNTAWIPGTLALIVIVPWLLRERPLHPVDRAAVAAGTGLIAWVLLGRLTDPYPWPDGAPWAVLAIESTWWAGVTTDWFQPQMVVLCALGTVATAAVLARWATLDRAARRGLGWLALGTGAMTLSFLPLALPAGWVDWLPLPFMPAMQLVSQAFFPAAALGVVLRQRLWGIDLAVSRTLVWSLLTGGVIAVHATVVAVVGAAFPGRPGLQQVVSLVAITLGILPARAWLQRRIDHLVRGDAAEPWRVVRRVGQEIGAAGDAAGLVDGIAVALVASLRLGAATITAPDGAVVTAVGTPSAGADARRVELRHQHDAVGRLDVAARTGERLDVTTEGALAELAPVVAAAVHLAATTRALAASRARIAEARDEERRALRRELHDGLGPALAGVGLGLQAARNLLASDPAAAGALLARLGGELDASVEEVRSLARGLVPPVLDELGLVPALTELAERSRVEGIDVHVEAGDHLDAIGADTAGAIYAIAAEAIRNVHRHAAASRVSVLIGTSDVLLAIVDDGIGVGPDIRRGVGLTSMRERAEGIGGRFRIEPVAPHGTRVEVRVPSPVEASRR